MRKLNVKRIIKLIVVMVVLVITILLFIHSTSLSYRDTQYREIYVCSGDTLWDIAKNEQQNNNYFKGKDIREIIFHIKKINNLPSSDLNINQKILIPSL